MRFFALVLVPVSQLLCSRGKKQIENKIHEIAGYLEKHVDNTVEKKDIIVVWNRDVTTIGYRINNVISGEP